MKLSKKQLRQLIIEVMHDKGLGEIISEAYVGFPDKPPVKASKFLDDYELPEEYSDRMRTNLKSMMGSEDRESQQSGLVAATSLDPDNEVLQAIDAAGGYNFAGKDDGPLDKTEATKQSLLAALENARPFVGKKIESYIIYHTPTGDDEINDIILRGDTLDQIYGLLEEGKNAEAKEVAANYLDTEFLYDNHKALEEFNLNVAPSITKLGITDFSDLCLNYRKGLDFHVTGLLPQDFDLHTYHQRNVDVNTEIILQKDNKMINFKIPPDSGPKVSKQVYKFARRLGVLSQSYYTHPIQHHFFGGTPIRSTSINVH